MGLTPAALLATASVFVWFGMVLAISFLEAPLKFRAPGVTVQLGLGIGRLVFRALNVSEVVLAIVAVAAILAADTRTSARIALGAAVAVLLIQLAIVRPRLSRRTRRVLASEEGPRSHAHLVYVALEAVKVPALITAGVLTAVA